MSQHLENKQQEIRPSGQNFSFDIVLASHYGIEEALLIHHFQHWIRINKTKGTNFIDERTWTYQTMKEIAAHFPFLSYEQVKYAIENLEKKNVIQIGNYNKCAFDKTNWYSFVKEDIFVPDIPINSKNVYERENSPSKGKIPLSRGKIPEPIPDTKPNTISTNKESSSKANLKNDDDVFFNDQEKEELNNYSAHQISEAIRITKESCLQSKNSIKVKYFFTTLRNLKESPKKAKITPYEELKKHFKHGSLYNQAECNLTEKAISFTRGMNHKQIEFKYFSWDSFQKICEDLGIKFKR